MSRALVPSQKVFNQTWKVIYPLCVDDLNSNAFGAGLGDARKAGST